MRLDLLVLSDISSAKKGFTYIASEAVIVLHGRLLSVVAQRPLQSFILINLMRRLLTATAHNVKLTTFIVRHVWWRRIQLNRLTCHHLLQQRLGTDARRQKTLLVQGNDLFLLLPLLDQHIVRTIGLGASITTVDIFLKFFLRNAVTRSFITTLNKVSYIWTFWRTVGSLFKIRVILRLLAKG